MSTNPTSLIRNVAITTKQSLNRTPLYSRGRTGLIDLEIQDMLAKPTWSVRSLLPKPTPSNEPTTTTTPSPSAETDSEITPAKLHHLLRLSALPLPSSPAEEEKMLNTLRSQIHFVREIQKVDTRGVEPLQAIRDETPEAIAEQTVTLDKLQKYLDLEDKVGKNGTVRRRKGVVADGEEEEKWDPFELGVGSERRRKGRYFVVKRKKAGQGDGRKVG